MPLPTHYIHLCKCRQQPTEDDGSYNIPPICDFAEYIRPTCDISVDCYQLQSATDYANDACQHIANDGTCKNKYTVINVTNHLLSMI